MNNSQLEMAPLGAWTRRDSDPLLKKNARSSGRSSREIKNEPDVETGSLPCCRICLECDGDNELISPCKCKGTQQFVHRSCLDHWRSVKVIAVMGGFIFLMDKEGTFRNSLNDTWDHILSKRPIPFYYCMGVLAFFVLVGVFGLILHCALNTNDQRFVGCQNCFYGWGLLECFPVSVESCFVLVVILAVVFAILGIAYGFLATTMAIQRIWQRHYTILTKRELTQEYIVEHLYGSYSPPELDPGHEFRLKILKLL